MSERWREEGGDITAGRNGEEVEVIRWECVGENARKGESEGREEMSQERVRRGFLGEGKGRGAGGAFRRCSFLSFLLSSGSGWLRAQLPFLCPCLSLSAFLPPCFYLVSLIFSMSIYLSSCHYSFAYSHLSFHLSLSSLSSISIFPSP